MTMQVNVTTKVNSQAIRRETHNGRAHLVLPSYTLPANVVMNGGLYSAAEIDAHYQGLEGTLAPLGHPTVDGQFVSAFSPEGINAGHIGAWNRNVKKSGNRIYAEKWVDTVVANQSEGGRELLERVAAIERGEDVPPIHTSVAVFLEQLEANEEQKSQGIEWVAKINAMDHDAILLHEVGAAQPEQGVGLMVNADQAKSLKANSGALVGESYRERERRIEQAARDKFVTGPDDYAWIADFTDSQAIVIRNGGDAQVYGYSSDGGKITFDDAGSKVARQESWVAIAANKFKSLFTPQEAPATNHQTEGDMPLTKEELEQIGTIVSSAIAANNEASLKPITEALSGIQANQKTLSDALTANSRAEEQTMRDAVKAVHGDIIANALTGEALKEMFSKLGEATQIGANSAKNPPVTGAPDPAVYFGGAA
ncbi:hypothetical protein AC790_13515 [Pantoea sp. RIT-PI-b]|uniref:hypothetical protein n=1 Tax=Pantoea sp. RIT-PI-b TaxID=1681195 RepID=UPI00067683E8|nr:hypothetical protein [Pantoea sp. RIT-PI-b]KNC11581.1 hypothetical protein AC790_13515 [Pantoea sp. RIT-PI-b]